MSELKMKTEDGVVPQHNGHLDTCGFSSVKSVSIDQQRSLGKRQKIRGGEQETESKKVKKEVNERNKKQKSKKKKKKKKMKENNEKHEMKMIKNKRLMKKKIEMEKKELEEEKEVLQLKVFSVDMSKLPKNRKVVQVEEIQQFILSILARSDELPLPAWATLSEMAVDRVAVVLLKHITAKMFSDNEDCMPNLSTMFKVVFPFENSGHHVFVQSPVHTLLTIELPTKKRKTKKRKKNDSKKIASLHAKDYILTEKQLLKNDFLIPGISKGADNLFTIPESSSTAANFSSQVFALDCEMCMTSIGKELTRISVVDSKQQVMYDTLVKPENEIIDYLTRYSGITEADLCDVTTTLKDVHEKLTDMIPPDAILAGHSLEFDFAALKFFHNKIIDTSVIYADSRGRGFKQGLKQLAKKYLKKNIQDNMNGHCSVEDARTCMQLVQLKISQGPEYGLPDDGRNEISLFDYLEEKTEQKGAMMDDKATIQQYAGAADCFPCRDDATVVTNVVQHLPTYNFVWSQFHHMDFVRAEDKACDVKPLLQHMDSNLADIHSKLPEGTMFIVILGAADTSRVRRMRESGEVNREIKEAADEIKHGLCFMKLL